MSLEEALANHTAALNRNSDLLEILTSKATGVIKESDKAAGKDDADKPARRGRPAKATKAPTADDMTEASKKFLNVDDDAEYKVRREFVIGLTKKLGAEKFAQIKEDDRQEAIDALADYEKNGPAEDGRDDDV